jgi:hypothetical protein
MHVPANQTLTRAERKKFLLLQGALYRLELSSAAANLKQGLGDHPVARLIRPGRLLDLEGLLPVLLNILPLVTGKSSLSVWLRRAVIIAGAGGFVLAALRRKREPAEQTAETPQETPAGSV